MKQKNSMIKAISYYRVSKKSLNGIRMQENFVKYFCKNNNIQLKKTFADKGFSGMSQKRPAINSVLGEIKQGKTKALVVYSIDRLGRDFYWLNNFIKDLEKKDIKLISATQTIDMKTPQGKFNLRMLTALAEYERNMTSLRTKHGINYKDLLGIKS